MGTNSASSLPIFSELGFRLLSPRNDVVDEEMLDDASAATSRVNLCRLGAHSTIWE
jgi:hypothetical protein